MSTYGHCCSIIDTAFGSVFGVSDVLFIVFNDFSRYMHAYIRQKCCPLVFMEYTTSLFGRSHVFLVFNDFSYLRCWGHPFTYAYVRWWWHMAFIRLNTNYFWPNMNAWRHFPRRMWMVTLVLYKFEILFRRFFFKVSLLFRTCLILTFSLIGR